MVTCLFVWKIGGFQLESESFGETKTAGEACGSLVWLMLWWEAFF